MSSGGHLSPLLKLFPVYSFIGGKVSISLCTCKISCATSITSVISYAKAICSEWSVGISFVTFRWWYPFILFFFRFSGAGAWSGGVSEPVPGPLQAPGIETKEDSCRCLNGPAHMKWLTDTHTRLSAGISKSDSLPTYGVGWTCTVTSNRKQYSTAGDRNQRSWTKKKKKCC